MPRPSTPWGSRWVAESRTRRVSGGSIRKGAGVYAGNVRARVTSERALHGGAVRGFGGTGQHRLLGGGGRIDGDLVFTQR